MGEEDTFRSRTGKSARLFSRAKRVMPGGVCHTIRYYPPYPFYAREARGGHVFDVDGNDYVDFWMGHGALILGHTPGPVIEAIREQVATGCQWGMVNELQVELAEAVVDMVPCAEMVRFCNTGAEATMYACRLARGFTGRSRLAKIEGGWHGFNPDLLAYIHHPQGTPESTGLNRAADSTLPLPFNDLEGSLDAIRSCGKDLAAIVVEPVLGSGGFVPAEVDYLRGLREVADELDTLLVFDEVITGFRLGPGGGQEHFGVTPDLATLGKILGGGMPIGAVVGSEDVLGLSDATSLEPGEFVAIGGGTFSANPITMRAGLEVLRHLKSSPGIYERLARMGERARRTLEDLVVPERHVRSTGIGSLFRTHFCFEEGQEIRSAEDAHEKADEGLQEWFKLAMANRGIYILGGGGAISTAHTDGDLERLRRACENLSG